jgi:hypothetical protein
MTCSIFVISDVLFQWAMTTIVTALTALVFASFWYALPLWRRLQQDRS